MSDINFNYSYICVISFNHRQHNVSFFITCVTGLNRNVIEEVKMFQTVCSSKRKFNSVGLNFVQILYFENSKHMDITKIPS